MSPILSYRTHVCQITGWDTIEVEHDGTARWVDLQDLKNEVWGKDAVAFEMFPPEQHVVNGRSTEFHFRHIWKLPEGQPWPNIRPEGV